jgi:ketosteroid isomerase-like protein
MLNLLFRFQVISSVLIVGTMLALSQDQIMSNQNQKSRTEDELIKLEKDLFTAIKDKDLKRLDQILSDDFIYRSPMNSEQKKEAFLKTIKAIPLEMLAIWSEGLKVNVYSEVAVVTGIQKAKVRDSDGKEAIGATAFTDVFIKSQGNWRLVLAYGVELPTSSPHK